MKKLLLILIALSALFARADELKLTNKTADELCAALMRIGPGLTGTNALRVARAVNTLRPVAEAYAAGLEAERVNRKIVVTTKTDSPEFFGYIAAVEKLAAEPVKVELTLLNKLSDEEAERLSADHAGRGPLPVSTDPATLAIVLRYLESKK